MNTLKRIVQRFFSPQLDLRVQLFNILALAGFWLSLYVGVVTLLGADPAIRAVFSFCAAALSAFLMWYAARSGKYELCYAIAVAVIFFGLFTALLVTGGANGSLAFLPVLGVLFTVMLLKGKKGLVVAAAELLYYAGLYALVIFHPEWYLTYDDVSALALDMGLGFLVLCGALALCVFSMMRLYDRQKERLEEQNAVLAQANRAKTEFLANTSHEMRTPLTVISVNVQKARAMLEDMGEVLKDPETVELLSDAQSEIMRMSRMVGGMLNLASISENTEKSRTDLSALLRSTGDMLWLMLQKHGNELIMEISEGLAVFGDSDLLSQVVVNLIHNANDHTVNDSILLRAVCDAGTIAVTVRDNGAGIPPEILPRVFERGASGKAGGTGYGLFLCKAVVESHGGSIGIESEAGKGTAVHFTLPVYEGQYGGDAQ